MAGFRAWAALIMIAILLITWLKKYVFILIGILILLWIIRKLADIFWQGRDEGKW